MIKSITPELVVARIIEKQGLLSTEYEKLAGLEKDVAEAGHLLDKTIARMQTTISAAEKLSDDKIMARVMCSTEYDKAKADMIIASWEYKKCKNNCDKMIRELKSLEDITVCMSVDLKYLGRV